MNRRLLGIVGAAALAVIGTFAILVYVRDADDRAEADLALVEVYMVDDHVAAGTSGDDVRDSIVTESVQADTLVAGVLTDVEQLDGKVAAVDLVPGEQLLLARLIDEAAYDNGRTRLTAVPDDKHEVTISLDPERAIGGRVVPGDTVSVIASFAPFDVGGLPLDPESGAPIFPDTAPTDQQPVSGSTPNSSHILLHKVVVTAVQLEQLPKEETDADGNPVDTGTLAPTGNLLVTLALDAPDVERLVFTAEFGLLWLTYEPEGATEDGTAIQTRGRVYVDGVEAGAGETETVSEETTS